MTDIATDPRLKLTLDIDRIAPAAMEQIKAALELPYLKTLAIMPDVHAGYDLPIGGVALLDGYIWPGAVGSDIGCGMCHINTHTQANDTLKDAKTIYSRITDAIPVGFAVRSEPRTDFEKFPNGSKYAAMPDAIYPKAAVQLGTLGTLGGGNHFIELGQNKNGELGITIHSGSRRPGMVIGDFYMRMTGGPVPLDSDIGKAYLKDMTWAEGFALANRRIMMAECLKALDLPETLLDNIVNENHNHAIVTDEGVLHRKGATPAEQGQTGIIQRWSPKFGQCVKVESFVDVRRFYNGIET